MTTTAPTAGRRSRARKGEGRQLRDQILDATERLLLETGSTELVSIRAVADAVGVTPPSIYRHFPDKSTLIYEVSERRCGMLDDDLHAALAGIDDPVEGLVAIGCAYVRFGVENPEPYRLVFMSRYEEGLDAYGDGGVSRITAFATALEWAQKAVDAGRLRPGVTDATRVSIMMWAHVHGLASLLISKPTFAWPDDAGFVEEYVAGGLAGLLADPPPAGGA